MYIKGFSVGFDKNKRLWFLMFGAVFIAVTLIIFSFIHVYHVPERVEEKGSPIEKIFELNSYEALYKVKVEGNKNRNEYQIQESYQRKEENESFTFLIQNEIGEITYQIQNGTLKIYCPTQMLEYSLSDYMIKKKNRISFATFIELYQKIQEQEKSGSKTDGFKILVAEYDNKVSYQIILNIANADNHTELYQKYNEFNDISKLEVILNQETGKLEEYLIYNQAGQATIEILYDSFSFQQ